MQLFFFIFKNNDWNCKKLRNTSTSSINLQRQQHWEWQRMSMERESVKETWSKCNGERYFIIYRHIARDLMHWLLVYLSVNWKYLRIWHFMGRWKPLLTLFHWRSLPLNSVMSLHTQTATHKFARLRNDNVSAIKSFASKIERGSRKKNGFRQVLFAFRLHCPLNTHPRRVRIFATGLLLNRIIWPTYPLTSYLVHGFCLLPHASQFQYTAIQKVATMCYAKRFQKKQAAFVYVSENNSNGRKQNTV